MNNEKLEEIKFESERLWNYFEYHASQRIQTFKFFVVLCAAILSGSMSIFIKLLTDFARDGLTEQTALTACMITTLGIILFVISYAFNGLDNRNNEMISWARDEIIKLEESTLITQKIFTLAEKETDRNKSKRYSYYFCLIFILFKRLGILLAISPAALIPFS